MSQIFDRLGNLIKSAFSVDPDDFDFSSTNSNMDPDMQSAWDELNDFLNEDDFDDTSSAGSGAGTRARRSSVPPEIAADFKIIEVPVGSTLEEVKHGYKKMAIKYHPDKFANKPGKLKNATEMMKSLNVAYQNIKKYYKNKQ